MNTELKQLFLQDIDLFEEKLYAYKAGEIDRKTYKGFSGGFGSYAQREEGYMLRLRMAGGRLTKERLAFLADSIKAHNVDLLKLTTCQTIQLHNLEPASTVELMKKALDVDIVTRGGGGDFPRNVMVSPLSGVEQGEYFDVYPWAEAAAEYLLTLVRTIKLPRKLKVAFSNSPANTTHATFRDLGFVARENGHFDVYCAGGLGPNPKIGVKVAQDMNPEDIIACIDAMIEVFTTFGNYENRGKSRTRYLQDTLGQEGLREEYQKALAKNLATSKKVSVEPKEITKASCGEMTAERLIPQKQSGLYSVSYHPIGGIFPVDMAEKLYETIKDMSDVECRISPDGTLYIINLNAEEATVVLDLTKDGATTPFEHSVSCIGASICQQGLRNSQALLAKLVETVKNANLPSNALPKVHISGCASSCGTQQVGTLGFQGSVKLVDKKPCPAFQLLFNGSEQQGKENLGEVMGTIVEDQIPDFIVELGKAVADSGLGYDQWICENEDAFREIVKKYC